MDRNLFSQIWPVFFAEASEYLQELGEGILELERDPSRVERLDAVRRVAHSLKGTAASLGLEDVERIAHAIEDSLSGVGAGRGLARASVVAALDAVEAVEEALKLANAGGDGSVPRAVELLSALAGERGAASGIPSAPAQPSPLATVLDRLEECLSRASAAAAAPERRRDAAAGGAALAARIGKERGDLADLTFPLGETFPAVSEGGLDGARATAAIAGLLVDLRGRDGTGAAQEAAPPGAVVAAASAAPVSGGDPRRPEGPAPEPRRGASDRSIRVLAGTVDSVSRRIELFLPALSRAGRRGREMVSVESDMGEAIAALQRLASQLHVVDAEDVGAVLTDAVQRLAGAAGTAGKLGRDAVREAEAQRLAATAIREELRTLRMIPASEALEPLRRTVRDAAVRLGKEVELTLSGHDVKLDRQILDDLRDPLMHLVRNAVDHGIESPEARRAASKPPAGGISVRVEPRGNRVAVVVEDDGAGLDLERLKASAVRRGALTPAAAQGITSDDAARLVFLPGLSTASEVTAFSGRGVGLDVVHEAVARLRGKIDLSFVPGRGTRFSIDLPLTLATTTGIVVRVGRELAVVPSDAVERVVRIRGGDVGTVAGTATIDVEGVHLPVAHLARLLGAREAHLEGVVPVLVLAVGAGRAAVAVEALVGLQEVVVSSLGSQASRVAHLGGATILDDGRVVPVLNAAELLRRVRPGSDGPAASATRARVVIADDSLTTRTAMKSLLEIAGYEVLPAADGQEALDLVRQAKCDLVVSDVQMPRLDGLGLTRAVKGDPRLAATPVILVTSLGSAEDRVAGLSAGAEGYLVKKEVQGGRLLELVRQLLPVRP